MDYNSLSLKMHEENKGKVEVISKVKIKDRDDLSTAYTPGVAEPCRKIRDNKADVYKYTCKGNMVAVVSDGTAVLGLGDLGLQGLLVGAGSSSLDLDLDTGFLGVILGQLLPFVVGFRLEVQVIVVRSGIIEGRTI